MTAGLGDTWTKLPRSYSQNILSRTPEFQAAGLSMAHINRLCKPPYVSNVPQIIYRRIRRPDPQRERRLARTMFRPRTPGPSSSSASSSSNDQNGETDVALVLCSDGLIDLYEEMNMEEGSFLRRCAAVVGDAIARHSNAAIALLRDAIGGPDLKRASANLSVEMEERWMDDTTIIVQKF